MVYDGLQGSFNTHNDIRLPHSQEINKDYEIKKKYNK